MTFLPLSIALHCVMTDVGVIGRGRQYYLDSVVIRMILESLNIFVDKTPENAFLPILTSMPFVLAWKRKMQVVRCNMSKNDKSIAKTSEY